MHHRILLIKYYPFLVKFIKKRPFLKKNVLKLEKLLILVKKKCFLNYSSVNNSLDGRSLKSLFKETKKLGLFDFGYYQRSQNKTFRTEYDGFRDYYYKSFFSDVNPSIEFSTSKYYRCNLDIFNLGINALEHYVFYGRHEGRHKHPVQLTTMRTRLNEVPIDHSTKKSDTKIAVTLHIYYLDFVPYYINCLQNLDFEVDVFITLSRNNNSHTDDLIKKFAKIDNIKKVIIKSVPNRGRNFGPLLVEYANELLSYDLFCHLHSKKSLYSGKEQKQWASYLGEYLLRDKDVVNRVVRLFKDNNELGIYYPKTFFMLPDWTNHWLKNFGCAKDFCEKYKLPELNIKDGFLSYPAGGMFWARPSALRQILLEQHSYNDFPSEPLPNDGSELHAVERILGSLARANGFKEFFYIPDQGAFTLDPGYIFDNYKNRIIDDMYQDLSSFDIISFDIFDTLLRRDYSCNDYAKFVLGKKLVDEGIVDDPTHFVSLRNDAEAKIRKKMNFKGDLTIYEVYDELSKMIDLGSYSSEILADEEFINDYNMISEKDEMISLYYKLLENNKKLFITTDTYYTEEQIIKLLKKVGIYKGYQLFVSSKTGLRKDNGTIWEHFVSRIKIKPNKFIHIGDNIVSDCQIPGDYGLRTYSILNPLDKLNFLGVDIDFHLNENHIFNEVNIKKYGKLISNLGRYPFL